jgi:peptidoglycan-N-acetylglucosamine deacetylase
LTRVDFFNCFIYRGKVRKLLLNYRLRIRKLILSQDRDSGFTTRNLYVFITNSFSRQFRNLALVLTVIFFVGCEKETVNLTSEPALLTLNTSLPAPCIALTFDDGPDPVYTGMILKILKDKNVKATFFCVGNKMKKYPKITKRIFDEGHTVANHTTDHSNIANKSFKDSFTNIMRTEKIIDSIIGSSQKLFRPPWGKIKKEQKDSLSKYGIKVFLWNVNSEDFAISKYSPYMIVDMVIHGAQNNDIILFHDSDYKGKESRMSTVIALPQIIDILKAKGYVFKKAEDLTNNNKISETKENLLWE